MVQAITTPQQERESCKHFFEQCVYQYQQLLYKKAYEVLQNHPDTEDAVQEALLKAYEHFLSYTEDRRKALKVQAWLCTIVHTTALNMRRDKKDHDRLDTSEESQHLELLDTRFESPEVALMREETWQVIHKLMLTFPAMIRFLLKLHFVLGYEYAPLALFLRNQLNLEKATSGALRTRIHRGLILLRSRLEEAGINNSDLEAWSEWDTAFDEATELDELLSAEQSFPSYLDLRWCSHKLRIVEDSSEDFENQRLFSHNYFDSHLCGMSPLLINRSNMLHEGKVSGRKICVESTLVEARQVFLPSQRKNKFNYEMQDRMCLFACC